jgi:hypothetical protein
LLITGISNVEEVVDEMVARDAGEKTHVSAARLGAIMNESQIQEWRRRGKSEKGRVLAYFLVVFAVAIFALFFLAVRTPLPAVSAPLPLGHSMPAHSAPRLAHSR